jgi:hypothetical protein
VDGRRTNSMVLESSHIQTELLLKGIGWKVMLMDSAFLGLAMAVCSKENGKMIFNMGKGRKPTKVMRTGFISLDGSYYEGDYIDGNK